MHRSIRAILAAILITGTVMAWQGTAMADEAVYGYDNKGRLKTVTGSADVEFEYDEVGNLGNVNSPASIKASPQDHNFGTWWVGHESAELAVTLINPGLLDALVTEVVINGPDISDFALVDEDCTVLTEPARECQARVIFNSTTPGEKVATLVFNTTSVDFPSIVVPLAGFAEGPPVAAPNVNSSDYEVVFTGLGYSTETYTLTNDGNSALMIYDAILTNSAGTGADEFVIVADNCSGTGLAPGESCTIEVMLDPESTGTKDATITFETNMPGDSTIDIPLTGEARVPDIVAYPSEYDFGAHHVNDPEVSKEVTFLNRGDYAAVVNAMAFQNVMGFESDGFVIKEDNCTGKVISRLGSCTVLITFNPFEAHTSMVSLMLISNSPYPNQISGIEMTGRGYSGSGLPVPGSYDYGLVPVGGESSVTRFRFKSPYANIGYNIYGVAIGGTDANNYYIKRQTCEDSYVGPSMECYVDVVFAPATEGAKNDAFVVIAGYRSGTLDWYSFKGTLKGTGYRTDAVTIDPATFDYGQVSMGGERVFSYMVSNDGTTTVSIIDTAFVRDDGTLVESFTLKDNFCADRVLAPGENCLMTVTFAPVAAGYDAVSLRVMTSDINVPAAESLLEGIGLEPSGLYMTPKTYDYGPRYVGGDAASQTFTLKNDGVSAFEVQSFGIENVSGTEDGEFEITSDGCIYRTLATGESCSMNVMYISSHTGQVHAQLVVNTTSADSPHYADLYGEGMTVDYVSIPPSYDFGSHYPLDSFGPKEFLITHTGDYPIHVSSVYIANSTGDYTISYNTCTDTVLNTLDTCVLRVTFKPQALGPRNDVMLVAIDSPFSQEMAVPLFGRGDSSGVSVPYDQYHFGLVQVGENSNIKRFRFEDPEFGSSADSDVEIDSPDNNFKIVPNNIYGDTTWCREEIDKKCYFDIQFTPTAPGLHSATITISTRDTGSNPDPTGHSSNLVVTGEGYIANGISLFPSTLDFGEIAIGANRELSYTAMNNDPKPLFILQSTVIGNSIAGEAGYNITVDNCIQNTLPPGGECTISVEFSPVSIDNSVATLKLLTSSPDFPVVEAEARGTGLVSSGEYLTPLRHSFGDVYLGLERTSQMFTLLNDGNAPFDVMSIGIVNVSGVHDDELNIVLNECTGSHLEPTESCLLDIEFAPITIGAKNASLVVNTSAAGVLTAEIVGSGIRNDLISSPSSFDFGNKHTREPAFVKKFRIVQTGSYDIQILDYQIIDSTGAVSEDFTIIDTTCEGALLGELGLCEITVQYKPLAVGADAAMLNIVYSGSFFSIMTLSVDLHGRLNSDALQDRVIIPQTYDFGVEMVGSTSMIKRFYFSNFNIYSSSEVYTIKTVSTSSNEFVITDSGVNNAYDTHCLKLSGGDLHHNKICYIDVFFAPDSAGYKDETLTVSYHAIGTARIYRTARLLGYATNNPIEPSDYDYGSIPIGTPAVYAHTFDVINNTPESIAVLESGIVQNGVINTSDFEIISDNCVGQTLIANSSCQVEVAAHPKDMGLNEAELVLLTSDTDMPVVYASLSATSIEAPVIYLLPSFYDFGTVTQTTSEVAEMHVYNIGFANLIVNSIGFTNGTDFSIVGDNCTGRELLLDERCNMQFEFYADIANVGSEVTDTLSIVSNDPLSPVANMTVSGSIGGIPAISLSSSSHDFGPLLETTSENAQVTVYNIGTSNLIINSVSFVNGAGFSVAEDNCSGLELPLNGNCIIQFSFYADSAFVGSVVTDFLKVLSSDPANPIVELTVSGSVTPYEFSVTPASHDFGIEYVGSSTELQSFTISNPHSVSMHISGVSVINAGGMADNNFTVANNNCTGLTLAYLETCSIDVAFTPESAGAKSAMLRVAIDSPLNKEVDVPLSGEGIELDTDGDGVPDRLDSDPNSAANSGLVITLPVNDVDTNTYGWGTGTTDTHYNVVMAVFDGDGGDKLLHMRGYGNSGCSLLIYIYVNGNRIGPVWTPTYGYSARYTWWLKAEMLSEGQNVVEFKMPTLCGADPPHWGVDELGIYNPGVEFGNITSIPGGDTSHATGIYLMVNVPEAQLLELSGWDSDAGEIDIKEELRTMGSLPEGNASEWTKPYQLYFSSPYLVQNGKYNKVLITGSGTSGEWGVRLNALRPPDVEFGNPGGDPFNTVDRVSYLVPHDPRDMEFSMSFYDVDTLGEVELYVDGSLIGNSPVTGNDAWGVTDTVVKTGRVVSDGFKEVEVVNTAGLPETWGVKISESIALDPDMDGDGVGDLYDSDPDSANDKGWQIWLLENGTEPTLRSHGNWGGTYYSVLKTVFIGDGTDKLLRMTGYGDYSTSTPDIYVNGELIGYTTMPYNSGYSRPYVWWLTADMLVDGLNVIEFKSPHIAWGVKDLGIYDLGAAEFGNISGKTYEYYGFYVMVPGPGEKLLELSSWDSDSSEIDFWIYGKHIGALPGGIANDWTRAYQLYVPSPYLNSDVSYKALWITGSGQVDDWGVRLNALRPAEAELGNLLNSPASTKERVSYLVPHDPRDMQFEMQFYDVYPEGEVEIYVDGALLGNAPVTDTDAWSVTNTVIKTPTNSADLLRIVEAINTIGLPETWGVKMGDSAPIGPDSDGDGVPDILDSDPNSPDDKGFVIWLPENSVDETYYGWGTGPPGSPVRFSSDYYSIIKTFFYGDGTDKLLHMQGYSPTGNATTVGIYLNGSRIGEVPVISESTHSGKYVWWLPADMLPEGKNEVEFRLEAGENKWAMTELGIYDPGVAEFGYIIGGDTSHPYGFYLMVPGTGDKVLRVSGWDSTLPDEIFIKQDTTVLGTLPYGGPSKWTDDHDVYLPSPYLTSQFNTFFVGRTTGYEQWGVRLSALNVIDENAISVSPNPHDYGGIYNVGSGVTQEFTLSNNIFTSVAISNAAIYNADSATLDYVTEFDNCTGQTLSTLVSCTIDVRFAPVGIGASDATLRFLTDNPVVSVIDVPLSGEGLESPQISVTPVSYDFGNVPLELAKETLIQVNNLGIGNLTVSSIGMANGTEFSVVNENCTGHSLALNEFCTITATFMPDSFGSGSEDVLLIGSNDPVNPVLEVSVSGGVVVYEIGLAPESHDFGSQYINTSSDIKNTIVTNYFDYPMYINGVFVINAIGQPDNNYDISVDSCTGNTLAYLETCTAGMTFNPQSAGTISAQLMIAIDSPLSREASMVLNGVGVEPPKISVNPASYDFGEVYWSQAPQANINVRNIGGGTLVINSVGLANGTSYSVVEDNCTGQTITTINECSIVLRFSPETFGQVLSDTLSISSNDLTQPVLSVPLSGSTANHGITISPVSYDFGDFYLDEPVGGGKRFVVTHAGDHEVSISNIQMSGAFNDYSVLNDSCGGSTLSPFTSCSFEASFIPQNAGVKTAAVEMDITGENVSTFKLSAFLNGGAYDELPLGYTTPSNYDYGEELVGQASLPKRFYHPDGAGKEAWSYLTISPPSADFPLITVATDSTGTRYSDVAFRPISPGVKSAISNVTWHNSITNTIEYELIAVAGVGVSPYHANLSLSPDTTDFGSMVVATNSAAYTFTLQNDMVNSPEAKIFRAAILGGGIVNLSDFETVQDGCSGKALGSGASCDISIIAHPASIGLKEATLSVISYDPDVPVASASLSVLGYELPEITIVPESYDFGIVLVDDSPVAQMYVNNTGKGDLIVNSASIVSGTEFEIVEDNCSTQIVAPGGKCGIQFNYTPTVPGASSSGILRIYSDDSANPEIDFNMSGTAARYGISVSPEAYNFGNVDLGGISNIRLFTVTNRGIEPLAINGTGIIDSADFGTRPYLPSTCFLHEPLATNESCLFVVHFTPYGDVSDPASEGLRTGTLQIRTDDPRVGWANIPLSGYAVFNSVANNVLTVKRSGMGRVTSYPSGIDCGIDCSYSYAIDSTVVLSAVPDTGYEFIGWSGETCSGTGDCIVTLDSDKTINALFSAPAEKLDLAFVIDTSGSMWDDIAALKAMATEMVQTIHSTGADYRIAVVDYRDYAVEPYGVEGDYPYHVVQSFTADPLQAIDAIESLILGSSLDTAESVFTALINTIGADGIGPWREDAERTIVLLGDAPPHNPELFTGYTLDSVIEAANSFEVPVARSGPVHEMLRSVFASVGISKAFAADAGDGIVIYTVLMGNDPTAKAYFDALASGTGGKAFEAPRARDIAESLLHIVGDSLKYRGPICEGATASQTYLWPPNHKMVDINVDKVYDVDGDSVTITITGISQDEPVSGKGAGNSSPDGYGVGTGIASLRAERQGGSGGRVYKIDFTATSIGGQCTGSVFVCASHDQGDNVICVDNGQMYDSSSSSSTEKQNTEEEPLSYSAPICEGATASQAYLWPPNNQMVDVNVENVIDPDGDSVTISITGITQDEPVSGKGAGNSTPDGYGVGTSTASLRAERQGGSDGRVYKVDFTATSTNGQCTGSVLVCASHDQGDSVQCIDSGQMYESSTSTSIKKQKDPK